MPYVDPDVLWEDNPNSSVCFIFCKNGKLYHRERETHEDLEQMCHLKPFSPGCLKGRISGLGGYEGQDIVAFWPEGLNKNNLGQLKNCLQALLNENLIHEDYILSTPGLGTRITVESFLNNEKFFPQDVSATKNAEKARQIHLLKGKEKNQALKDRGVKPKTPIGVTMGLQPGQKHWSIYGDHVMNFNQWIENLADEEYGEREFHSENEAKNYIKKMEAAGNLTRMWKDGSTFVVKVIIRQ